MRLQQTASGGLKLWLSARETGDWARSPYATWPCSQIADHRLFAEFEANGDLVDFALDGRPADVDAQEFNAITSDFISERFPRHPAASKDGRLTLDDCSIDLAD